MNSRRINDISPAPRRKPSTVAAVPETPVKPNKTTPLAHLAPLRFKPVNNPPTAKPRALRQVVHAPPQPKPVLVNIQAQEAHTAMLPARPMQQTTRPGPISTKKVILKPQKIQLQTWQYCLILGTALAAILFLKVPFVDALILSYLVAALILSFSSNWSFGIALVLLALQPFLAIFKQTDAAENFAVYAFYFLCIGVILAVLEYRRET